jgi:ubiquinone/menaquinone biosynthesis C-methylase UbiE
MQEAECGQMKLNSLGRVSMNNPVRATMQRRFTASVMRRLGGPVSGGALEVGCGRGVGLDIIVDVFGPARVFAFDLDPKMIQLARRRLGSRPEVLGLAVADATAIPVRDSSFDAVFDFGAIHLIPGWSEALSEVRRVLRPGGKYFFELVTSRLLRAAYPLVTDRFRSMRAPHPAEFLLELRRNRIAVEPERVVRSRLAALSGFVGDLVGVGTAVP